MAGAVTAGRPHMPCGVIDVTAGLAEPSRAARHQTVVGQSFVDHPGCQVRVHDAALRIETSPLTVRHTISSTTPLPVSSVNGSVVVVSPVTVVTSR
jgi:hypothetical protein